MAVEEAEDKGQRGMGEGPSSLRAIGELLRGTREAKGVAMAQAQMDTKIRTKYLEALERGDDAGTPGVAYFKGFLRFYANYLGLDGPALVARYKELKAVTPAPTANAPAGEPGKAPPERPRPLLREAGEAVSRKEAGPVNRRAGRRFPFLVVAAFLIVAVGLLGLAYARGHKAPVGSGAGEAGQTAGGQGGTGGPSSTTPGGTTGDSTQTGPGTGTGTSGRSETSGSSGPTTTPDLAKMVVQTTVVDKETTRYVLNAKDLSVDLDIVERCWVRAVADGTVVYEEVLEAGKQMKWTAKGKFVIRFGNPGGVRLKVNSAPVDTGPVEQPPKTLEFHVKG
ncbi:MAG: helix-turn-helix domain-containing protein [Bacillota bacterium]